MLGHFDAEFYSALRSRKLRGVVITGGILYNSDGDPNLLNASRNDDGRWLNANYDNPDFRWPREYGFAFVVPQPSSFLSCFCRRVLFICCSLNCG